MLPSLPLYTSRITLLVPDGPAGRYRFILAFIFIPYHSFVSDLLRGQSSSRFGVLGHGVPDGREGQHRDHRRVRHRVHARLHRQQRPRQPGRVQHEVGAARGQKDGCSDHHESDARHAGGRVRKRGASAMGVRQRHSHRPVAQRL